MPFDPAAIFIRALLLNNNNGEIRFTGRYTLDGVTWTPAGSTGYVDAQTAGYAALGGLSFQFLGDADMRGPQFQIGIEVNSQNGTSEGMVTLSADAAFGAIRPERVDLTPTAAALPQQTPTAALIPGADTISTYGCGRVRIEIEFNSAPAQAVVLYLATGNSTSTLTVDSQVGAGLLSTSQLTLSFLVEAPSAYSTVYYTAPAATTGSVSPLAIVRMP